jgi:hypothetical protein
MDDDLSGLPAFEMPEPIEPGSLVTVEVETWSLSGITSVALEQGELVVFRDGRVHVLPPDAEPSRIYWATFH